MKKNSIFLVMLAVLLALSVVLVAGCDDGDSNKKKGGGDFNGSYTDDGKTAVIKGSDITIGDWKGKIGDTTKSDQAGVKMSSAFITNAKGDQVGYIQRVEAPLKLFEISITDGDFSFTYSK